MNYPIKAYDSVAGLHLIDRPLNSAGFPDHEMLVAVNHHAATSLGAGLGDDEISS